MSLEKENKIYCLKCNWTRWKTKIKGKEYQCRNCGGVSGLVGDVAGFELAPELKWWQKLWSFVVKLFRK